MSFQPIQDPQVRQVVLPYTNLVPTSKARPQPAPVDGNETARSYNSQSAQQQARPEPQQGGWITQALRGLFTRSQSRRADGQTDRWWQKAVDWGVDRFRTYRTGEASSTQKGGWLAKIADWGVSRYRRYQTGLAPEAGGAEGAGKKKGWFNRALDWGIDRYRESNGAPVQEQRTGIWASLARGALNWWQNRKS